MPRKARKYINTRFFHVMCQGINKENIFETSEYKKKYLEYIKRYKAEFFIDIVAYCVMNNHVHLLLHSYDIEQLSKFMHKLNCVYAMMYNRQKKRVGYVFRDRFRMEGIVNNEYLSACIVYIHNNPVKAGICKKVYEYKYSSYNEFVKAPTILDNAIIKQIMGEKTYKDIEVKVGEEECDFLDVYNSPQERAKDIVKEFENKNRKKLCEILEDNVYRRELLEQLHVKNKISYRCIEKVLPISRKQIKRYLIAQ